jgi:hypothetical protein
MIRWTLAFLAWASSVFLCLPAAADMVATPAAPPSADLRAGLERAVLAGAAEAGLPPAAVRPALDRASDAQLAALAGALHQRHAGQMGLVVLVVVLAVVWVILVVLLVAATAPSGGGPSTPTPTPDPTSEPTTDPEPAPEPEPTVQPGEWTSATFGSNEDLFDTVFRSWLPLEASRLADRAARDRGEAWDAKRELAEAFAAAASGEAQEFEKDDDAGDWQLRIERTGERRVSSRTGRQETVFKVTIRPEP